MLGHFYCINHSIHFLGSLIIFLELWRRTLESKVFRLSKSKTEYMKYDFSATTQEEGVLDSMVMWYLRKTHFATWDRCSKRIEISVKMLVVELKPAD
jgi:hypothetical protein